MNFTIGAVSEPGAVSLSNDGSWLSLPQAVIVEARSDIELARDLTAETTALLIIKANQRVARLGDTAGRQLGRRAMVQKARGSKG